MADSNEVEQLREDATQTARDIIAGVEQNFISKNDFTNFSQQMEQRFVHVDEVNDRIINVLTDMNNRLNNAPNDNNIYERLDTPRPLPGNDDDDSADTSTHYDLDHDVIMRSRFAYTVNQVPDPGNFTGNSNETDLFCQLCEDTFKTYPNKHWPEDAKINFVKSRLVSPLHP